MNVFITGGSGFIGSSLQQYLSTFDNYNIFAPQHKDIDLLHLNQIQHYITDHNITHVIHTACVGARRYARNTIDDVYTNLLMFENIITASNDCSKVITFGSGGEYDINTNISECKEDDIYKIVPEEYGGFLKSIIAKRMLSIKHPKCFNLRFFGGFGISEANDRFIKGGLLNIINNKPIVIHQNRWFDFIYIKDLALITHHALTSHNIPQNINCVYPEKYTLLDIANILLDTTQSSVGIKINTPGMGLSYTGNGLKLKNVGIPLIGLTAGIQDVYKQLLSNNNNI